MDIDHTEQRLKRYICAAGSTAAIVVITVVFPLFYRDQILSAGKYLFDICGKDWFDLVVFMVSAVSSTPLAFPVWTYAVYGTVMGYDPYRIIILVSAGSTCGSYVTYIFGKYFGDTTFVKRKFPLLKDHPWSEGESIWFISLLLFGGTVLPLPVDIVYALCGMKRYPNYLFFLLVFTAKVITYYLIVSGWDLLQTLSFFSF